MLPLNYAILKHFTSVQEACADDIIASLRGQYGHFKAFKKPAIINAIMTAEANGLLEESRFEMDSNNEVIIFYRAHAEGAATINRYIKE